MELISKEYKIPFDIELTCFDSICRSCLVPSVEMRDLFFKYKMNIGTCVLDICIQELIYACTQITMNENDGLPRLVCETCIEEASSAFAFRNQNLRSDEILRKILVERQLLKTDDNSSVNRYKIEVQCTDFEKQKDPGKCKRNIKNNKKNHRESEKYKLHLQSEKRKLSVESHPSKVSHVQNIRITRSLKAKNDNEIIQSESKIDLNNVQMISDDVKSLEVSSNKLTEPPDVDDDVEPDKGISTADRTNPKSKKSSPVRNNYIRIESILNKEDAESSHSGNLKNETVNDILQEERQDGASSLVIDLKQEILEETSLSDIFDESCMEFDKKGKKSINKKKKNLVQNDQKKSRRIYEPLYEYPDEQQQCSICSQSCATVSALVKHRSEIHGSKKYQCVTCGNGFTTTRGLRIHLRLHTGEKPEICSTCGKAFSDPRTLKNHERIHSGDQPFPCPICGKRFPARLPLAHHFRSHTGERPHQCQLCNKAYVQAHSLQVHMRTHTGVKPYPCDICGKAFTNNTSLSVHMLTHNGVKNFQCPICGKRMARSGELTVHLRTHSGERPFSCSICQKAFTNSGALRVHMPTHTGVKNFVCTVCGKRVARAIELRVHMRTHTGERMYSCQHCHKKFSTSSNMRLHERKHTGEKPFVCNECGRGFADSHVLRNHERTHTGERPHVCSVCGRAFAQHSSLRTHLNTHHRAARKTNLSQLGGKNITYNNTKAQQLPDTSGSLSKLIQHYVNPTSAKLQTTSGPTSIDAYNANKSIVTLEEYDGSSFRSLVTSDSTGNESSINTNAIPMLKTVTSTRENINNALVPVTLMSTDSSTSLTALNTQHVESETILSQSHERGVFNRNKNQLIKFRKCSESNQFTYH